VDVYDPLSGTWSTSDSRLEGGRINVAAAVDPAGRIYALGGFHGAAFLNTMEVYYPADPIWQLANRGAATRQVRKNV
jgi:hypothetical protein